MLNPPIICRHTLLLPELLEIGTRTKLIAIVKIIKTIAG